MCLWNLCVFMCGMPIKNSDMFCCCCCCCCFCSNSHETIKLISSPATLNQDFTDNIKKILSTSLYKIKRVVRFFFSTFHFISNTNRINLLTLLFIVPNEPCPLHMSQKYWQGRWNDRSVFSVTFRLVTDKKML